jgi:hypothetical protein
VSYIWLRPAYETRFGNLTAKSILVLIADQANADGQAHPSIDFIVRSTEVCKRTVLRVIQIFGELGLVTRFDRGENHTPGLQLNPALLGTDLREQYARALNAVLGKKCLRDTMEMVSETLEPVSETQTSVSETQTNVSETQTSVSETFPPHPHIGGPVSVPLLTHITTHAPAAAPSAIGFAAASVMQGCGFVDPALERVLCGVIDQETESGEETPTIARAMIEAWQKYTNQDDRLRFKWSAPKFFAHGYWKRPKSWPWDAQVLREEALTRQRY